MSFKPYPEYKDSGVEWIGDIPVSWTVQPLLAIASESRKRNLGMIENNLLSLSYGNIVTKDIASQDGLLPQSFETYQIIERDDIVFRLTDLQNDKRSLRSALVPERGIITAAYLSVTPRAIVPEFFAYAMRDADLRKVFYSMGGGLRQSMKFDDMKRLPVVYPPLPEQESIVDFLDRETSAIDAFIADQEELITLLNERRAATITQAVTKGLDPNAPMKDSGIEWLGASKIPETWSVWKLGRLVRMRSGNALTSESIRSSGTYPVYGGGGFRGYTENYTNEGNHILIGRQGALCGNIKLASGKFYATEHAIVTYPEQPTEQTWLASLLEVMNLGQYSQSAAQPGLSVDVIAQKRLPVPPSPQQKLIAKYLDEEISKIDATIADAREAIALSKERRAALISAAVTGKIDVRDALNSEDHTLEGELVVTA